MRAYVWRQPEFKNFGDELTPFILDKLGVPCVPTTPHEAELVMIGSVLEHLPSDWAGTVCGTGKLYENSRIHLPNARVFAVRGKLTLAGCVGLRGPIALGDPGLLLPKWVRQPYATTELGVVPHWSDKELHRKFSYGQLIDPCGPPEKVVEQIVACKRIVSSSLHGLIVADAFGIPRQAELFPNSAEEGGDFKYRDYASLYDGDPHFGHMWQAPRSRVKEIQDDLLAALQVAAGIDLPEPSRRRHPQMSLLVPFRDDGEYRSRVWAWLRTYWRTRGLDAEIIQGHDLGGTPFSKARAVNHAATLARGRVFVILDADAWMAPEILTRCADEIEAAVCAHRSLWHMPYTDLYRLSQATSLRLLDQDPTVRHPFLDTAPPADCVDEQCRPYPGVHQAGHQYGAMAQVMPREAFYRVNGMHSGFVGWGCCDEKTEIFTAQGWKSYQGVNVGDSVLTLNHKTGLSEWKPIQKMNVYEDGPFKMLSIETTTHSSLSTMGHRWPVIKRNGERIWRTTETLNIHDRIPISAKCADLPTQPIHDDALVELIAWFITEGHIIKTAAGNLGRSVIISQSKIVHPKYVEHIESALTKVFGQQCVRSPRSDMSCRPRNTTPLWWRADKNTGRDARFRLNPVAGDLLQSYAPDKVPSFEFLLSLTQHQLELFIDVAMRGDGHVSQAKGHRISSSNFEQRDPRVAEAFGFAVLLSGRGLSIRKRKQNAKGDRRSGIPTELDYAMTKVHIRSRDRFSPLEPGNKIVDYDGGPIWCPTTANGTWLARREGSVYWTGNSEDVSLLRSLDTLYGQHTVVNAHVLHLWHEHIGHSWQTRKWVGQPWGTANSRLAQRHSHAYAEPEFMRQLADEHVLPPPLYY